MAFGQKLRLDYALVPDSLRKNADAIIRNHTNEIERLSLTKMTHKVFKSITVLNEKGDYDARIFLPYDKQSKVVSLSGRIYNSSGILVKTLKMNDFYDSSTYADLELFSDNRAKMFAPNMKEYPYTVEYEYLMSFAGHLHIGSGLPVTGVGVAVQEATYRLITPSNLEFKIKTGNYQFEYSKELNQKNLDVHQWKLKNFKALKFERYMPGFHSLYPYVLIVPVKFEYDGSKGDLSTWNTLGLWNIELLKNRMVLSEPTVLKIRELTADLPTDREKVKAIYQYVQQKTRYINISLGIGGFQPMLASDVDKYGYGDCKALSNYTRTLLAAVGIPSNYTVIGAGSSKIRFFDMATFTQANHVILSVPLGNDTIWLECTNPHAPFGYVGAGNSNRKALIIKDDGGELVNMPHYTAADNLITSTLKMDIKPDGNAIGTLNVKTEGLWFDEIGYLVVGTEKNQKDYLLKNLPINNLVIDKFEILTNGDEKPEAILNIQFKAGKYGDISGNRMFIPVNNIDKSDVSFSSKKERNFDVVLPMFTTNDVQAEFLIPEGYQIDFLPKSESLESPYGAYSYTCELVDGKVMYNRRLVINGGTVKKENYPDLYDFFDKVGKFDNAKIVLIKI